MDARLVTLDLDPTDDPTHGAQQLSFFNGHYDSWCYLPVMGFISFNDEAEQYLCAAVLRPGNVTAAVGAKGILRRLINVISYSFPGARIRVRLDGGFAHPDLLDFLDAESNLKYVIAMAKNAVLKRRADPPCGRPAGSRGRAGRPSTSTAKPTMRPKPGRDHVASSSRPRSCGPRIRRRKTTHASPSPT